MDSPSEQPQTFRVQPFYVNIQHYSDSLGDPLEFELKLATKDMSSPKITLFD